MNEINKLTADSKFSLNLNWLYEDSPEFKEIAIKYILLKEKHYTIKEYCKKRKIQYENPEENWEKRKSMANYLSEIFLNIYININEDIVCDLTIPITIPRKETEYFNYFFHFRLNRIPLSEIDIFLEYHLEESFQNESETYIRYLTLFRREFKLNKGISDSIEEWIEIEKNKQRIPKTSSKLKWNGTPQDLINGFEYLMTLNCKKNEPYCKIKNIENFIYSNFDFEDTEIPAHNNNYTFQWNGDKHDFTVLLRNLKTKKIHSTNYEIKDFILKIIPDSSEESIMSYLKGDRLKQKFSIDLSRFN